MDELYLSSLDKLDKFEVINVCNSYLYFGEIDETFKKLFQYQQSEPNKIVITDIKENHKNLIFYLEKCVPQIGRAHV